MIISSIMHARPSRKTPDDCETRKGFDALDRCSSSMQPSKSFAAENRQTKNQQTKAIKEIDNSAAAGQSWLHGRP